MVQNRTAEIRQYPSCDLISVVRIYWREKNKKGFNSSVRSSHSVIKSSKLPSSDLFGCKCAVIITGCFLFTTIKRARCKNQSEGYKINKPPPGLLVYRMIMSLAERLSSKFHSCSRSFASLVLLGQPVFIFRGTILQPRALSSDIYQPPEGVWYLLNNSRQDTKGNMGSCK